MVSVLEGDDRRAAGEPPGNLDRILDRLCAAVHEERLLGKIAGGEARQLLGQPDVAFIHGHMEAGVEELVHLVMNGIVHLRVGVADIDHADAPGEIDKGVAVHVDDGGAIGAGCEDGNDVGDASRHDCFTLGQQLLELGTGDGGHDARCLGH